MAFTVGQKVSATYETGNKKTITANGIVVDATVQGYKVYVNGLVLTLPEAQIKEITS